ncbi:TPM domain-containing protein [Lysinibacillus odysseyi]|uniref:TPM domain-containing protein n=1 Tax=Lysinibacillus odysseyi TaxID=202611 RepID=UPI001FD1DA15|nr:TPM domain-containing protein [Lysinibacillus odysseyi]
MIFCLILLVPTVASAEIPSKPAYNNYVYDYGNVLEDDVEKQMVQVLQQLEKSTSNEVVVMTIDTIGDLDAFEFGTRMMREWGIGQKEKNNGMLIFATTEQGTGKNDVWISVGQGLEGDYPDGKIGRMIDTYMKPYLGQGDYTSAFANIINVLNKEMGGQATDTPLPTEDEEGGGFGFGILILILILYFIFSGFGGGGGGRRGPRRYYVGGFGGGGFGGSGGGFGGFGGGGSAGGGAGRKF